MSYAKVIWAPLLLAATSATPVQAAEITPHTAKYTLSLKELRVAGRSGRASGTMELRFSRDCFHWWVDRELKFNVVYSDGRKTNLVMTERLRETLSGKLFWFWSRTTLNGQTTAIIAGRASRPDDNEMVDVEPPKPAPTEKPTTTPVEATAGGTKDSVVTAPLAVGTANAAENTAKPSDNAKKPQRPLGVRIDYDWPDDIDIELSPDVIFPVTALRLQLDALAAGALLRQQPVFDGSRRKGAAKVVYGKFSPAAIVVAARPDGDSNLLEGNSWRFRAVHLPLDDEKSDKPLKTVIQKVHINGVISELLMDLGPFSIEGRVSWLKELPPPKCE